VCFFHIRQLWLIRRSLTVDTAHSSVRALVNSRLDYCNALFATLPASQMSRLQSVLRAAARFVLHLPGRAPVSSAMRNSHWLNFPQRVTYKLCLLTYKCLHGLAPDYLTRLCVRVATVHRRPRLWSSDDHQLLIRPFIQRTRAVTLVPCAFNISGPTSWNDLPAALCDPAVTLGTFRQMLKSFLFWLTDVYRPWYSCRSTRLCDVC